MERFKAVGAQFDPSGMEVTKNMGENEIRLALSDDRDIAIVRKGGKMSPLSAKFVGKMPTDEKGAKSAAFAQHLAMSLAVELERMQGLLLRCPPEIIKRLAANIQKEAKDGTDLSIILKSLSKALQFMPVGDGEDGDDEPEQSETVPGKPEPRTDGRPKGWPEPFDPKKAH